MELQFTTKTEWVYQQIRERILDGRLAPDDRLVLAQLAREFNTSEIPVREALRMLERDDLIELRSHRGATVARLTSRRACEIVIVRTHLEVLALREAIPHHDAASLAVLRDLLAKMDRLAEQGRQELFSRANRDFHTALYAPCPLRFLTEEIQDLWDRMWRTRSTSLFSLRPQRMQPAQREHRAVFNAVRRGDAGRAVSLLERHRDATIAAWRDIVDGVVAG